MKVSHSYTLQKQPYRGVLRKRCSKTIPQIYRRTPMPKCDFNNVTKKLYWDYWDFKKILFLRTRLEGCYFCMIYAKILKYCKILGTAQKMMFSIKDFFSTCAQIRRFLRIWSHLLKKSLIENFVFCAVEILLSKMY